MNILLATPEYSDQGVFSGSESVGDMTISNLQKRSLKRRYRTENLTPDINIDLGQARGVNCIALIAHNGLGSVTIKAGSTDSVSDYTRGSLDLISGADVGHDANLFLLYLSTPQTYRYWSFDIDDTGNPDGYFQAGRVYLSNAFVPDKNISYGEAQGFLDNSRINRARSGEVVPVSRVPYQQFQFSLSFATENELYGSVYDIDRLRGLSKDVLFVKNAESTTHFQRQYVYGLMNDLPPITNTNFQIFQKSFKIEELPA